MQLNFKGKLARALNMGKVLNLECAYMTSKRGMMWIMISGFAKKMPVRVKWYVRENWGCSLYCGVHVAFDGYSGFSIDRCG